MTTALLALSLAAGCTSNPQPRPNNIQVSTVPVRGSAGTVDEGVGATRSGPTPSTSPMTVSVTSSGPGGTTEPGTPIPGVTVASPVTVPSTISRPVATVPPPVAPAGPPSDDVWYRLAQCESGVRNLRNDPYSGYFQFLPSTWRSLGLTGEPADHSYEEQRAGAIMLQARSGWGQWPACSRKLGLR